MPGDPRPPRLDLTPLLLLFDLWIWRHLHCGLPHGMAFPLLTDLLRFPGMSCEHIRRGSGIIMIIVTSPSL